MFRFIVRRLIWAVPTLLIVTFLVYVAIRIGTDPVASFLRVEHAGDARRTSRSTSRPTACTRASAATSAATSRGSAASSPVTGRTASRATGRCGRTSRTPSPTRCASPASPRSSASSSACTFGVFAALKPGSLRDGSVNTTALVMLSIPPFVSAIILQMVFAVYTRRVVPRGVVAALPDVGRVPAGPAGLRPRG